MQEEFFKNVNFIDEARIKKILDEENKNSAFSNVNAICKNASNPIKSAFFKFIHTKDKFNSNNF